MYPTMRFSDADAALAWLQQAFGFEQLSVYRDDQGVIGHAELSFAGGAMMFGPGDPTSQSVYVAVDDADAHYERAKAAGAEIVSEPEDKPYGSREYTVRDLDGHVWSFGTYRPGDEVATDS
jgi:uncharacterized glyoxalase superfamily protein PhnB